MKVFAFFNGIYKLLFFSLILFPSIECFEKKKMTILVVVPCFPKIHDVCMLNQIIGLISRGHDVFIYAPKRGDEKKMQKEVATYNLLSKTIIGAFPANLDKFDIVLFQLGHKAFNIKKTHNFKGKVVVCFRGYDVTGFIHDNPRAYDELFISCDLFLPVCNAFKDIIEKLGCDPRKIIVHHSGINCSRFKFRQRELSSNGPLSIISVGRFVEKKGFVHAIRAIARLIERYPNIRYRLIGDGPLKKRYRRLIRRLGIEKHVIINGWFDHEEYIRILDQSSIFIMPSVTAADNDQEGIPNVIKEAMALGLLVIATDHSGISELVEHRKSGFLVPERNSMAIVRTIDHIMQNGDKFSALRQYGRRCVQLAFDTEKLNNTLESVLLQLLSK